MQQVVPGLSAEAAVLLDLGSALPQDEHLAIFCILTRGLKNIWETRLAKKVVSTFRMRAEIEAKVAILRKARYQGSAIIITELIRNLN